jgi:hypothetical protein
MQPKFRVWDKKNKRFLSSEVNQFAILGNGKLIVSDSDWFSGFQNANPDDYIVQGFAGLQDKNGKGIYKGDIFKGGEYKWDAVEFEDAKFIVNLRGARVFDLCELFEDICEDYYPEVIGNIFENPDLLK